MKKIIVAAGLLILLGGYAWWDSSGSSITATNDTTSAPSETTNPVVATTGGTGGTGSTGSSGRSTGGSTAGAYKDGTYKGNVANAFYGNLQVVATISGGKITNITYPISPNDRPETRQINAEALPMLKQEAILAQSAKVDIVSGATQSSEAFVESLGNALAQAKS